MLSIEKYEIREHVLSNGRFNLYRAINKHADDSVLLKVPDAAGQEHAIAALLHEYNLLRQSRSFGIKAVRLENLGSTAALVRKDESQLPLSRFPKGNELPIPRFLELAVQLSFALEALYDEQIVHNGFSPDTLFVQPSLLSVDIMDYRFAFKRSRPASVPLPMDDVGEYPEIAPYLSPEHIALTGSKTDHRSDLYSLGVVLYELLAGALPYTAEEPSEWKHAIIAKEPQPITSLRSGIPLSLFRIIGKLLEKGPKNRYQTAYGLRIDLEICRKQWNETGDIASFPLGEHDRRKMFQIPDVLYGRDREKRQFGEALQWVKLGAVQTLWVTGSGGIGKTALIREICRQETTDSVYLSTGRFDRLQQEIPYYAIVQVFRDLLRQVFARERDTPRLSEYKRKFQEAFAVNAFFFCETVPELQWFIRERSVEAIPEKLSATERQVSLHQGVRQFVSILTEEFPLFLILDDVHWADPASLQLLASIMTDAQTQRLLLVCCYRDHEVDADHPLSTLMEKIADTGAENGRVALSPLAVGDFAEWVRDSLHCDPHQAAGLARLLFDKTAGNPLYFRQLLQTVFEDGVIWFDNAAGCWTWSDEVLQNLNVPEDLSEFLAQRLKLLSGDYRLVTAMASCLGEQFDLSDLAEICDYSPAQVRERLEPAIREGMILQSDVREGMMYRFLHDRVRTAAYACLPEAVRHTAHLKAGRMLLKRSKESHLFAAVHHLNQGRELISDVEERRHLVRLNLEAGDRAKTTAAFHAALQFYNSGIEWVSKDDWKSSFDLVFRLQTGKAECAYLCGRFEDAEHLFGLLMSRARHRSDRLSIYRLRMMQAFMQGHYEHATQLGIEILREFHIRIPSSPGRPVLVLTTLANRRRIKRNMRRITQLSQASDPEIMSIMDLLSMMCTSSALSDRKMHVYLVNRFIELSMKHGNSSYSPVAYASYAVMLGFVLRDYDTSCVLGETALLLADQLGDRSVKGRTYGMYGAVMHHWRYPAQASYERLSQALRFSLESGDAAYTGYAIGTLATLMAMYEPVDKLMDWILPQITLLQELYPPLGKSMVLYRQFVLNMKGLTEDRYSFSESGFNEPDFLRETSHNSADSLRLFIYCNLKLRSQYVFGNYREAIRLAERAEKLYPPVNAIGLPNLTFYWALSLAAVWEQSSKQERRHIRRKLKGQLKYLGRMASQCPDNFRSRHRLVAAEVARIEGDRVSAESLYEEAIQAASDSNDVQVQAAAVERAFLHFDRVGESGQARRLAEEAYRLYAEWGATAKLQQLVAGHSHLYRERRIRELDDQGLMTDLASDAPNRPEKGGQTAEGMASAVKKGAIPAVLTDYALAIVPADYNIGNEADLVRLFDKLATAIMQYAGASNGVLLMEKEGNWFERACFDANGRSQLVSTRLEESVNLSSVIAGFAVSSREAVMLDCAYREGLFVHDPYVRRKNSKSICCIPVSAGQGAGSGALYLENPLVEGVFSGINADMLYRLAKQAMYSLRLLESFKAEVVLEPAMGRMGLPLYIESLTERELEVLRLMAEGFSNDEIADRLAVASGTVKVHARNIFSKLNVNRRTKAILVAQELRLIQ